MSTPRWSKLLIEENRKAARKFIRRNQANRTCEKFLEFCRRDGWPQSDFEELRKLWWRCNDPHGLLTRL